MPVSMRIGELARQQGLTIKALAERAGVAYNTAHALYTGRALRIDLDTLDRMCTALGTDPGDVFVRHAAPTPTDRDHGGNETTAERATSAADMQATRSVSID